MKNKILVIRGGAIGDFILTLPVFQALRSQFMESEIHVLGYPKIAGLSLLTGHVDAVHPIEAREMAGFFARNGTLDKNLMGFFDEYGLIISYLFDPDEIFQTNVGRATKAQFIVGRHRPLESADDHATSVFLQALEKVAVFGADPEPRLDKIRTMPGASNAFNQPVIAFHPGSGSATKNWPEANWAVLIQSLVAETDFHFLAVGGEAEADRYSRLTKLIPGERLDQAFSVPLNDLAGRLSGCHGFIGHDSGISHLAAAVGLPGVLIWPSTNPKIWAPVSRQFRIIHSNNSNDQGIDSIAPTDVFSAAIQHFQ